MANLRQLFSNRAMMASNSALPALSTFTAALKARLQANLVTSPFSIPLDRMQVTRNSPGGVVSPR